MRIHVVFVASSFLFVSLLASGSDTPNVTMLGQLSGTNVGASSVFGASAIIGHDTIAIGEPTEGNLGAIYIYEKPANGWGSMNQTAILSASNQCELGQAIAMSADASTVVSFAGGCSGGGFLGYGWLEVFVRPASGWQNMTQPTAILTLKSPASVNDFGEYLSISADGQIIAATGQIAHKSFVSLFVRPAGGWVNANPNYGFATPSGLNPVALSGNNIAVVSNGAVLVFQRGSAGIKQVATLTASDGNPLSSRVVIAGGTIVAGAPYDPNDTQAPGAAYLFVEPLGGWMNSTETAKMTADGLAAGAWFGYSLSLSAKNLLVGGYYTSAGYLYTEPATGWLTTSHPTATLTVSDPDQVNFGRTVAISGSTMVVGDPSESANGNFNGGAAWVFQVQ
ncbi:MAG: putative cell wall-anchored protein [Candidatus Sulfotelmatobacter sp.]|nr:putative cell wall-anchored protein [Candidatus Sulfotelmatobacter sp.]